MHAITTVRGSVQLIVCTSTNTQTMSIGRAKSKNTERSEEKYYNKKKVKRGGGARSAPTRPGGALRFFVSNWFERTLFFLNF